MQQKSVGIIGGMGPEATVDLMVRIIKGTPALDDCDHIRMLVDNNPKIPSRIKALIEGNGESPIPCLQEMARRLESLDVDFLAMPCNTAHYYHRDIQRAIKIPLLDMVDLSVRSVIKKNPGIRKVGLLASTAVIHLKIYEIPFARKMVRLLTPTDTYQSQIMAVIKKIKTSSYGDEVVEPIQSAAENLTGRGAGVLLVACTELSIIGRRIETTVNVFDSAQILADAVIKEALKPR